MSSVKIAGALLTPIQDKPDSCATITFTALQTYEGVIAGSIMQYVTSSQGAYDFELRFGRYSVQIMSKNSYAQRSVGGITINQNTPSPISLDFLIGQSEPLTPEEVLIVQELVERAEAAAISAGNNAVLTADDRTHIDQVAVSVDSIAEQVSQNALAVANAKSDIDITAEQVNQKAQQVEENTGLVARDKESVERTAEEVATAQAVIGTSIDGVYANAAGLVSINDTILRLHPII